MNKAILNRAYRKADKAQAILASPNLSEAARDKALDMLRDARNLTARAYGMPERY